MVEELAVLGRPEAVHVGPHPVLAEVDAAAVDLQPRARREQVGGVVPAGAVDIVAIGPLQVADGDIVLRRLGLAAQHGDLGLKAGEFSFHVHAKSPMSAFYERAPGDSASGYSA